jgi:alkyl hydroperoxide reductase subunit AhpC
MIELGQLERRYQDFKDANIRVIVSSVEGTEDAAKTKEQFPHLLVLADKNRSLSEAAELIHPHSGPNGDDTDAPTTIIVDGKGMVRWVYRPHQVFTRLTPDEVLQAVDRHVN